MSINTDGLAVIMAAVKHANPLGCQGCARLSDLALQAHRRAEAAEARAARLREQLESSDVLLACLEALENCEWAGEDGLCPACDRYRESGHHEGCALAYALAGVRTALAPEAER